MSLCLMCGLNRKDERLEVKGIQGDMTIERNVRRKTNALGILFRVTVSLQETEGRNRGNRGTRNRGKERFHAYR